MDEPVDTNPLPPEAAEMLLRRAREARRHAYAPYSSFPVGAALLTEDGEVYTGCNVENASYGLTICAERTAVAKAVSEGIRGFRAIAVVGPQDELPCSPCGSCRQVLYEFGPELQVVTPGGEGGEPQVDSIGHLLPGAFGSARLRSTEVGG
ncbi:MAG TPA: cytidine deaminase [Longimicrobiaceae bacterium]|nr:cytidine deaminase [Longimicrobiaceae bacterium]